LRQSSATLKEEKLSHIEWKMEAEIWAGFARFFTCQNLKGKSQEIYVPYFFYLINQTGSILFSILEITDEES
jgi:hypothetical protein